MRTPSNIMVSVFDPDKDPSVLAMLKEEQAKCPGVTRISCGNKWGMVETPKGTFCLVSDGVGSSKPIDKTGLTVKFYRMYANDEQGKAMSLFDKAVYSLAEVKACATGEQIRLDLFIEDNESNFRTWENRLRLLLGI